MTRETLRASTLKKSVFEVASGATAARPGSGGATGVGVPTRGATAIGSGDAGGLTPARAEQRRNASAIPNPGPAGATCASSAARPSQTRSSSEVRSPAPARNASASA